MGFQVQFQPFIVYELFGDFKYEGAQIEDLKNGGPIGSPSHPYSKVALICYYDFENLTWSGRAMGNIVTLALW